MQRRRPSATEIAIYVFVFLEAVGILFILWVRQVLLRFVRPSVLRQIRVRSPLHRVLP